MVIGHATNPVDTAGFSLFWALRSCSHTEPLLCVAGSRRARARLLSCLAGERRACGSATLAPAGEWCYTD